MMWQLARQSLNAGMLEKSVIRHVETMFVRMALINAEMDWV